MKPMSIRNAAYLAIFLHFARRIVSKISIFPALKRGDFTYSPNETHQVDVTIHETDSYGKQLKPLTYTGILQIKGMPSNEIDGTRDTLRDNLVKMNAGVWREAFWMHTDYITDVHFRIRPSELPYGQKGREFVTFKAKYGIATYSRIRSALLAGTKLLYLGHA
ncbi:MAG: hypothetical protein IKA48_00720 [Fibrobacter sp.]|nr:hypothetical protein [Fibrobacter sp.]